MDAMNLVWIVPAAAVAGFALCALRWRTDTRGVSP